MLLMQPPVIRQAEVFSALPEHLRRTGASSPWAEANRGGQPTDSFLEAPVFDSADNLYVADIPFGRVFRIDPQGNWSQVAEWDGEPNGMKLLDDGRLLVCDYRNGLMALEIATGQVRAVLDRRNSERFKGLNDLVFDRAGNLYFTDQGQTGLHDPTGRLYRLRPDGQLDLLLGNVPSPNGVALSPDERVLYLAVTRGNQVWRVPLLKDGSVSKVSAFFTSFGPSGPDGLAVDSAGRVLVANPGLGCCWVLAPHGEAVEVIRSPAGASLTNMAFGGPGNTDLYFTESVSGSILRIRMDVPGLALSRAPGDSMLARPR